MAQPESGARRLADLLIDPRESLEVELKGWLDIRSDNSHKATLAKALIALANHGGGFVLIGWTRSETGSGEALGRPTSLADFNTDTVNSIVAAYAEPSFHCDVVIETAPDGLQYPIINVPGGHSTPIRSKRDGPEGQIVRRSIYYIRRPGPMSESPQSGQEWDTLIRRCISNAREDLLDQIRTIIAGGSPSTPSQSAEDMLWEWARASAERWQTLVEQTAEGDPARLSLGHFKAAYRLADSIPPLGLADLREALDRATVRHSGWPPFWVPSKPSISPYVFEGALECWMGRDGGQGDAAHSDFWRVSPNGEAFLIRGYQEDSPGARRVEAGRGFDLTIPTWRVGEVLLHAEAFATQLGAPTATVTIGFEWSGLSGRQIVTIGNPNRWVMEGHVAQQDVFRKTMSVQADQIGGALPELVAQVVTPLYELFDFFRLPAKLVAEELASMRTNRF